MIGGQDAAGEAAPDPGNHAAVRRSQLALAAKRCIDVVGAAVGLFALSPVLAWASLAVRVRMGRPILFRQPRSGRDGRTFSILKFRTMRATEPGDLSSQLDENRITRLGQFLRSTSIDELPEFWNVLLGHMSLVGPRPLLVGYLPHYTPRERRRHEMRPGITGLAAVSGRHTLAFEERLELDVWYVANWSLGLDLRILARTVWQVLARKSVRPTQDLAEIDFPERFQAGMIEGRRSSTQSTSDADGSGQAQAGAGRPSN
jgi:sugar transferase EpsL